MTHLFHQFQHCVLAINLHCHRTHCVILCLEHFSVAEFNSSFLFLPYNDNNNNDNDDDNDSKANTHAHNSRNWKTIISTAINFLAQLLLVVPTASTICEFAPCFGQAFTSVCEDQSKLQQKNQKKDINQNCFLSVKKSKQ